MKIRFTRTDKIDTKELAQLVEDSKEETQEEQTTSGGTQE